MREPSLSVVIPTRDRREVLEKVLLALSRQSLDRDHWELIIVNDGSKDDTPQYLSSLKFHNLRSFEAQGSGPATARNIGIEAARGSRILLLGDDMIPAPDLLEGHLDMAPSTKFSGIQGRIEWDPEMEITALMHYMAPEGPQFYFKGMRDGSEIPFSRIYGANFSAPRSQFLTEPFDPHFRFACMEDTEMAWRWRLRGWKFVFAEKALCFHHHFYDENTALFARQRLAGHEARYCVRRHAGLFIPLFLSPLLQLLWFRLRSAPGLTQKRAWDIAGRAAYLKGWFSGKAH